jgi:hypothetical protein
MTAKHDRIAVYCDSGHERFVIAEWLWDDTRGPDGTRYGYWRQHAFGIVPEAGEGVRTKSIHRVISLQVGGDEIVWSRNMPSDYAGPMQPQYRLHCPRCGFNEVRNDGGITYGDDDDDDDESNIARALIDVFGKLLDNGVAEIEVRTLIRIAWG